MRNRFILLSKLRAAAVLSVTLPQITLTPAPTITQTPPQPTEKVAIIRELLEPKPKQSLEDISSKLIKRGKLKELKAAKKRCNAQGGIFTKARCKLPLPTPAPAIRPQIAPQAAGVGELSGSIGYALPYGNCVNQVPVGIRPNGSPISWATTTQTPYIGAVALWHYNHTGIVVGIWSNGDIEVRHENYGGGQHRFPRSAFRGFR